MTFCKTDSRFLSSVLGTKMHIDGRIIRIIYGILSFRESRERFCITKEGFTLLRSIVWGFTVHFQLKHELRLHLTVAKF